MIEGKRGCVHKSEKKPKSTYAQVGEEREGRRREGEGRKHRQLDRASKREHVHMSQREPEHVHAPSGGGGLDGVLHGINSDNFK